MKITYFVHSTTCDNEAGLATGWEDSELSIKGKQQTLALEKLVATQQFDAVFSSDAGRAIETATIAFGKRHLINNDWRLREMNYGEFSKQPSSIIKQDLTKYINDPFPGGESYNDVAARVHEFLKYLQQTYPHDASIAFVAHQAPQLALDVLLKGKTWEQAFREDWRNTHAWQAGWVYEMKDDIANP